MFVSDHILDMNGHSLYQNILFEVFEGSMEASYQGASVEINIFRNFSILRGLGSS